VRQYALRAGIFATLLVLPAIGFKRVLSAAQENSPGSAQPPASRSALRGDVHALGRLEPASGLVVIGARPGARIERIEVSQGLSVNSGQVLAVLEGNGQAKAQAALGEAQKTQVIHQRAVKKRTLQLEREQFDKLHKAKLDAATRVASLSAHRFEESSKIYKTLGAALQGRDRLEADQRYFELELQSNKAKLEKDSLEIAQQSLAPQRKLEDDELSDKSPDLDVLDRQIILAREGLAQTEIRAPSAGQVLEVMAHPGEISSGPILAMGDLSAIVATVEVDQSDLPRLRIGDRASVQVVDQPVGGKVTRIGVLVGRNQVANFDPRALQDRRVAKVTVALDDPTLAARFINMEVDVTIQPGGTGSSGQ
jgi:HlyD family secretion protein